MKEGKDQFIKGQESGLDTLDIVRRIRELDILLVKKTLEVDILTELKESLEEIRRENLLEQSLSTARENSS